jgi:hypothetical protein
LISRPPFPERPAAATCGAQGFVAGRDSIRHGSEHNVIARDRAILLPWPASLADRKDRRAGAREDGAAAAAGVAGAIRGHGAEIVVCGDPARMVRQHGAVAFLTGGERDRPDVARTSDGAVSMARCHLRRESLGTTGSSPSANASPLHALLAGLPRAVADDLETCAVRQQVQRPARTARRVCTFKAFCLSGKSTSARRTAASAPGGPSAGW